jgi:hypothetical protein
MAKSKTYYKEWYHKNKDRIRDQRRNSALKFKYSIDQLKYDELYEKQGGKCAICNTKEEEAPRQKLVVDHCHITKNVRGLLCSNCNSGLGMFKDDLLLLHKAKKYLTENP